MSIDARVDFVVTHEDGSGELRLVDRPAGAGHPGNRGQPALAFAAAPHEVTALNGSDVWGGANSLMLGDRKIARREGYGRIVFSDRGQFLAAVSDYHDKRRAEANG
jgi:hypothetical protein